jgi:hypothetical protein
MEGRQDGAYANKDKIVVDRRRRIGQSGRLMNELAEATVTFGLKIFMTVKRLKDRESQESQERRERQPSGFHAAIITPCSSLSNKKDLKSEVLIA